MIKLVAQSLDLSVIYGFWVNELAEHLNIVLFELARTYHAALQKVDVSGFGTHEQGITYLVNNNHSGFRPGVGMIVFEDLVMF